MANSNFPQQQLWSSPVLTHPLGLAGAHRKGLAPASPSGRVRTGVDLSCSCGKFLLAFMVSPQSIKIRKYHSQACLSVWLNILRSKLSMPTYMKQLKKINVHFQIVWILNLDECHSTSTKQIPAHRKQKFGRRIIFLRVILLNFMNYDDG